MSDDIALFTKRYVIIIKKEVENLLAICSKSEGNMVKIRILSISLVILILAGCGAPATATMPASVTPTVTLVPPTITPTFTPNPTLTNTRTPTPIPNACKLPEAANRGDIGLGFPRYAARMVSTGIIKAKVIFVDFPDAPAAETPESTFARISPGASDFFRAVSYDRLNLELEPYLVWLRMSKPSAEYNFERGFSFELHRTYIQEAISLADAEVDFSDAQAIYVMANPRASSISFGPAFTATGSSFGIQVDNNVITNGVTSGYDLKDWGSLWLNHEASHTLGLVDLYAFDYNTNNYSDAHRFVGDFSLMGLISGKAPEPFAYERWLLGWLDDNQVICQQTSDAVTTLTAIEETGGIKAVMVPTGRTTAVVVESRRKLGYDSQLVKPGALVYSIDTSIPTGEGPIKVFPATANDPYRDQSPLSAGESVTVENVTVTVLDAKDDTDTVEVTISK